MNIKYTVGLMEHNLVDIIKWSAGDVHPPLYYILLKLFTLIFGKSYYAMRIFSSLGAILFASLGLTHLKRDFGNKLGFWFSFCVLFSASTLVYALQIRMYTWEAYFVTLTAIYANRIFYNTASKRSRVLFIVFSVLSAYTHYFSLFAVAAINLALLFGYIKANEKYSILNWMINGAIQIMTYIPGAIIFLYQIKLCGADWITVDFPDLILILFLIIFWEMY